MKLYELRQSYQQILDMIDDGAEGLQDTLESLSDAIEEKVESIAKVVKTLEAEAAGIKAEEERLAARRQKLEGNAKRLKEYAQDAMLHAGIKKVKGNVFTVAIQKNPPSLHVVDEAMIPVEYFKPKDPVLDRKQLLADLKAGKEFDGAVIKQGESIRIK